MCADGWFVKDVFFFSFLVAEQRSKELVFPYSHFCLHPHGGCEIVHLCICIKST